MGPVLYLALEFVVLLCPIVEMTGCDYWMISMMMREGDSGDEVGFERPMSPYPQSQLPLLVGVEWLILRARIPDRRLWSVVG